MMMTKQTLHVAIVGGGISGLTAALALRKAGLQVDVFEQAQQFTEVGAGISLGPNAALVLKRLGLEEQVTTLMTPLQGFSTYHWDGQAIDTRDSFVTTMVAVGPALASLHRADLLKLLLDALPQEILHTDKRCVGLRQDGSRVHLFFADRSSFTADVVIGADGIHSLLRSTFHTDKPIFSQKIAYRGLIPMERLSFLGTERQRACLWMGPHKYFLTYPISQGRLMNIVAFVPPEGDWHVESWTAQGDVKQLAAEFAGWDKKLCRLIDALDTTQRWALYDREPLPFWSSGHITLLGDAAHAMLPNQGQGAGQGIEDAAFLAHCLHQATSETIPHWLTFYEQQRKPRTSRVQQVSRLSGRLYGLPDEEVSSRYNTRLAMEWLWDYDVDQAFDEALKAREC